MCPTGKVPHPTEESAQIAIAHMKRVKATPRKRVKHLNAYKCRECSAFHIGHSQRRFRTQQKKRT